MVTVDGIIDDILRAEGEAYTDDPADSGGPTKWGVTQKALAAHRGRPVTPAEVAALTRAEAVEVYRQRYYHGPGLHRLGQHSMRIAAEVMDSGVNVGPARAVGWLQRVLNGMNNGGTWYPDMAEDGQCGPMTAASLAAYLQRRGADGETVLHAALNCLQGAYYVDLAARREKDERFLFGWLHHRVAAQMGGH
ncbi:hypothetical protein JN531_012320 [Flagellatimonas centrodinii]|uniref:glycoside hydrolase family 108 protein n=1 Tax=Flagellatimonas centrodinii TaxID=2806210 RepID=UPI001FF028EE|nr:glycosyl hydrolase 108 family protein [Flagellatimonas centrodinii]ULQ45885.1 hypothetical protein JN531_012320 [Flagellatimonas centrodinii]